MKDEATGYLDDALAMLMMALKRLDKAETAIGTGPNAAKVQSAASHVEEARSQIAALATKIEAQAVAAAVSRS